MSPGSHKSKQNSTGLKQTLRLMLGKLHNHIQKSDTTHPRTKKVEKLHNHIQKSETEPLSYTIQKNKLKMD